MTPSQSTYLKLSLIHPGKQGNAGGHGDYWTSQDYQDKMVEMERWAHVAVCCGQFTWMCINLMNLQQDMTPRL